MNKWAVLAAEWLCDKQQFSVLKNGENYHIECEPTGFDFTPEALILFAIAHGWRWIPPSYAMDAVNAIYGNRVVDGL